MIAQIAPLPVGQNESQSPKNSRRNEELWETSQALEASFLSEMLKSTGLNETPEMFGGGEGEDQFSSFLRQSQAEAMVHAGGIGLARSIYDSLVSRHHAKEPQ